MDKMNLIAEVIPEKRTNVAKATFSYLVPEILQHMAKVGAIVYIQFGKEKMRGVIESLREEPASKKYEYEIREVVGVEPDFSIPKEYLCVARWISEYYFCSFAEAMNLFLPPRIVGRGAYKKSEFRINGQDTTRAQLTSEQEAVWRKLSRLAKNPDKPVLLHGVTGAGKTEIYLKLAEQVLNEGKQIILLTPEIILTPQILERFSREFYGKIALIHSGLSQGDRFRAYRDFANGKKPILIGPRSALLVPTEKIGAIIIDEEQEDAYKQEKDPRYHALSVAEKMAEHLKCLLLVGSATPRVETFYKAKEGKYHLLELKNRYQSLVLPPAKIVDLKRELRANNFSPISETLRAEIEKTLKRRKQVILFLNRRGMSTFVSCRDCGEVIMCPNCSIPLVYHSDEKRNVLSCHHCDHTAPAPSTCPNCQSLRIKYFGIGVERIEREIVNLFPKAKIKRVDARTMQKKGDYDNLMKELARGRIDILIGTQILAKGLDLLNVELVGVVSADVGLHMPFFRATEKTFQIVTQVSGRSGRRGSRGLTIIQTYWPDSCAIKFASLHDYNSFYKKEITERTRFGYPPFFHLVRVISEEKKAEKAKEELEKVAKELKQVGFNFVGPGKCFLSKINNKYRYHLIIKIKKLPDQKLTQIFQKNPYLVWDTDPVDLL